MAYDTNSCMKITSATKDYVDRQSWPSMCSAVKYVKCKSHPPQNGVCLLVIDRL